MNLTIWVFWCYLWLSSSAYDNSVIKRVGKEVQHLTLLSSRKNVVKNNWFVQDLDHFNVTDTRTWKQRYHLNLKYYKEGGPVFLLVGGREEISMSWMISGAWIEYAQIFNAACFQLEHRYYGMSQPTDNLNTSNLVYLIIEQVLTDLGTFINTISIEENQLLDRAKWVGFGSSYSGSLVTWLRLKYPHLVHAAVSSSSPLKAKINFEEYFMAVQKTLSVYNRTCELNIRQANKIIRDHLVFTDRLWSKIHPNQIQVDRYAAVIKKYLSVSGTQCLSNTYEWRVKYFAESSWNSTAVKCGNRQWLYQTCTKFGFFQTSNQDNHLFGNTISIEYYTDLCADVFGKPFMVAFGVCILVWIAMAISSILSNHEQAGLFLYKGLSIRGIGTLGLSFSPKYSFAVLIEGTSNCADIHPSYSSDPPQLTEDRKKISTYLNKFLREEDFSTDIIIS